MIKAASPVSFQTLGQEHLSHIKEVLADPLARRFLDGLEPLENWLAHLDRARNYLASIAFVGSAPVGFAATEVDDDSIGWLLVAVRADARQKGMGKMLIEHISTTAKQLGATAVAGEVDAKNHAARTFFERLGYSETVSSDEDMVRVLKRLA